MSEKIMQISEGFTYFTLALWFGMEVILGSNIEKIFDYDVSDVNRMSALIVLLLISIQLVVFQRYSGKEVLTLLLFTIPIAYATLNADYNILISTWLFIIATKVVDFDKVVLLTYVVLIVSISIVIILFFLGQIDDVVIFRGTIKRHSLGFAHPNLLGMRVFQLVISKVYLDRKRITCIDYLIILAGAWFSYKIPNCKTAYISLLVFLLFILTYKIIGTIEGGDRLVLKGIIVLAAFLNIISLFISYVGTRSSSLLRIFDKAMSSRFSLCNKVFRAYGITLFGQDIELLRYLNGHLIRKYYMDTAYVSILLRYGIVVYILFSTLYIWGMIRAYKDGKKMLVIILGVYALYGVMEINYFALSYNIFLISLSYPLYGKRFNTNKELSTKYRFRIVA